MDLKDLAGLSEPLKKLIEAIAQGVGNVSAKYLLARRAEGNATAIRTLSSAIAEARSAHGIDVVYKDGAIEMSPVADAPNPVQGQEISLQRESFVRGKRQRNIEQVTSAAAIELAHESEADERPVDEDWITRFFDFAQDVTNEQMQSLWGRLLAGEVIRPGTYSLRTLDFVRSLSVEDAALVSRLGDLALRYGGRVFVPWQGSSIQQELGLTMSDQITLTELGVFTPQDLVLKFFDSQPDQVAVVTIGDQGLLADPPKTKQVVSLAIRNLSRTGRELVNLVKPTGDLRSLKAVAKHLFGHGCVCKMGGFEHVSGGQVFFPALVEVTF